MSCPAATYVQHYEPEGISLVAIANSDILSGSNCTEDQALADALGSPVIEATD